MATMFNPPHPGELIEESREALGDQHPPTGAGTGCEPLYPDPIN